MIRAPPKQWQKRSERLKTTTATEKNITKSKTNQGGFITKQFTFYSLYAELLDTLTDEERGKIMRRICEFMFSHKEQEVLEDKKLRFLWGNIIDCLEMDKQAQLVGKSPKGLNRQMAHFTFYKNFYEAMELMDNKQSGQYVKAIYSYVFDGKEPKLSAPVDLYFKLAKRKLELSKVRSTVGKKGGKTERKLISTEQINAQDNCESVVGINQFLEKNPHVRNDIYKTSLHLTEGINWAYLIFLLPKSNYRDCKSLYQILSHYNEIMDA